MSNLTFTSSDSSFEQCDQMSRFFQYLALFVNENLLNGILQRLNFCQIQNIPSNDCQIFVRFCHSGEISTNLVTLHYIESINSHQTVENKNTEVGRGLFSKSCVVVLKTGILFLIMRS